MDNVASGIIGRETALANFDHARDDFEQALASVPEEALDYAPEGDQWSFLDLVPHVTNSINNYLNLLRLMDEAEYQEVRMVASSDEAELITRHREARAGGPGRAAHFKGPIDEMEAAHDQMAARLREMAYEEYGRQAAVYFPDSAEPYPTRASDILGWLTDHYHEHVAQVASMLDRWRNARQ